MLDQTRTGTTKPVYIRTRNQTSSMQTSPRGDNFHLPSRSAIESSAPIPEVDGSDYHLSLQNDCSKRIELISDVPPTIALKLGLTARMALYAVVFMRVVCRSKGGGNNHLEHFSANAAMLMSNGSREYSIDYSVQ